MTSPDETALRKFAKPYYQTKDAMHDMSHVQRDLETARSISRAYHPDEETITYAAYFHGIDVRKHEVALMRFLVSRGLSRRKASKVLRVASESHSGSRPRSIEGKILHDAHLVAGGKALYVARFLVTGALRGYSVEHTIEFFEENVDGRLRCYLPETRKKYAAIEAFGRKFFSDLKRSL